MNRDYLDEQRYIRTKNKIKTTGTLIIVIGLLIGGLLVYKGYSNLTEFNNLFTEENKQKKITELEAEKAELEQQIQPVLDKIKALQREWRETNPFENKQRMYDIEDEIEVLEKQIKPSQDRIREIDNEIHYTKNSDVEFQRWIHSDKYIPFFAVGGFIAIASLMVGGAILSSAHQREIMAYNAQAIMPVAQQGMDALYPDLVRRVGQMQRDIGQELRDDMPDYYR